MSSLEFKINDWIQAEDPDPRRANTAAEFVMLVDDIPATRLLDTWSRTVTDRARLPMYPLAEWFAANWWRLHAEAPFEAGQPPAHWRLSHDLTAIGGGFIWPRVRFASDDVSIQVSARAVRNAPWEPVRHLNDISSKAVPVAAFDHAIDGFISLVLQRLRDLEISAEPLATLWADVLAERSDPEVAEWRRWEARLGYDPDEAPERLMEQIEKLFGKVGKLAAAEVVPLLRNDEVATIHKLDSLAVAPGIEATLPLTAQHQMTSPGPQPWDTGRTLARQVRAEINRPTGPLEDRELLNLLGTRPDAFELIMPLTEAPIGLGVRFPKQKNKTVLHFRKRNGPGRRFEAARFLAESLTAPKEDLWLPLTDRGTARQKMQRAFAIELLAPIAEISERIGDARTSEAYDDVGDQYGVSPLAIRSHLANHGMLAAEDVAL
jgi:hypothetical protein